MNVIALITHPLSPAAVAADPVRLARRQQCAEAVEAARCRAAVDAFVEPEAAAFEAQCRRIRDSHYLNDSPAVFHVC